MIKKKELKVPMKGPRPEKPKAVKPKKKTAAKTLRTKADDLARAFCKRDAHCVSCAYGVPWKGSDRLEWAHIVSRGEWRLRHTPFNCVPLCNICHRNYTTNPKKWVDFIESIFPGRFEMLDNLLSEHRSEKSKPDYEYWVGFYKGREDNWMGYFAKELER